MQIMTGKFGHIWSDSDSKHGRECVESRRYIVSSYSLIFSFCYMLLLVVNFRQEMKFCLSAL